MVSSKRNKRNNKRLYYFNRKEGREIIWVGMM
jgi:hypothetical protein